jgi:2-keto-4-pentenoate hydratase
LTDIAAAQEALWAARQRRQPLSAHDGAIRELGLGDAEKVARQLYARIIASGDRCIGWKMGVTDPAAQRQLDLPGPVSAPLFASGCLQSGARVRLSDLMAPRIEVEIGFCGPPDRFQVCPLIEIADTRLADWPSRGALIVADYCLQSHIVVGPAVTLQPGTSLGSLRLSCDGDVVEVARPGAPPDSSLVMSLRPDEAAGVREPIIASGAQTKAHLLRPGLWVADFQGLGSVGVLVEG